MFLVIFFFQIVFITLFITYVNLTRYPQLKISFSSLALIAFRVIGVSTQDELLLNLH